MANLSALIKEAVVHNNIVDDNFNNTLAKIQKLLGTESGDFAGLFFADKESEWPSMSREDRIETMHHYISSEITYLTSY